MDHLFDEPFKVFLQNVASKLASAGREEDRPDYDIHINVENNVLVLPPDNNRVWQNVFKKCTEENMVVGLEFTTDEQSQQPIRAAIVKLALQFNRQAIFLRALIGPFSTHDEVRWCGKSIVLQNYTRDLFCLTFSCVES